MFRDRRRLLVGATTGRRHDPRLGSVSRAPGRFDNAAGSCRGGRQRPRHSTGRPPRRRRRTRRAPWPPPARWRTDPARGGGGGSPIPPTRQGCGRRPGRRQSRLQAPHPRFHRYHRPVRWIVAKNSGENGRLRTPVRRSIITVLERAAIRNGCWANHSEYRNGSTGELWQPDMTLRSRLALARPLVLQSRLTGKTNRRRVGNYAQRGTPHTLGIFRFPKIRSR